MDFHYIMHRDREKRLQRLQDHLALATDEHARKIIEHEYREIPLEELKESLKSIYAPSSREYNDFLRELAAKGDESPSKRFLADVQEDIVGVYKAYPAVWNMYLSLGGNPALPAVPSLDPDRRVQEIDELITQHAHRQPLLYLCVLADTIETMLAPLRSYASYNSESVCVVPSIREVVDLMAPKTHVIVNITAGKSWLPSKALLDAHWGDELAVKSDSSVFGRFRRFRAQSARANGQQECLTFRKVVVPEFFYLGFFSDRPFDPPAYFMDRAAGRVLDWRKGSVG